MANRAYLFSRDSGEPERLNDDDLIYYDSRYNIPLAWFFLFTVPDLKLYEVTVGATSWQAIMFVAEKRRAVEIFSERLSLLKNIVGPHHTIEAKLDGFLATISKWHGEFLLMDPSSIFQDDTDEIVNICIRLLSELDDPNATAESVREVICYAETNFDDRDKVVVNLIGYTY